MIAWTRTIPGKLFLVSWILFTVPFATNIVREHYPAFSLVEDATFRVDRYVGFHSDIFEHTDGHAYINNNVTPSVIAAVPLLVADPALDYLERITPAPSEGGFLDDTYQTDKPNRQDFFRRVTEAGLTLRFGGAAFVTVALLMAPLSALAVVFMFHVLVVRGMDRQRASWMALLFAAGTPILFRTLHLNHNLFLMYAIFAAFYLVWIRPEGHPASPRRRLLAGFLAGLCIALDYSGVVLLLVLYAYHVLSRAQETTFIGSVRESMLYVAGSVPPVLFLLYTQWSMFGNPILPPQFWMPVVNYTNEGVRGFSTPSPDLYWLNLFSPSYGMFVYGPLLLLAFVPFRSSHPDALVGSRERLFIWGLVVAFLTFCAANQYSRMQFNSGFRYLVPLLPFLFLFVAEHLRNWPPRRLAILAVPVVLHSWVMAVFREPVVESWRLFFREGITLPWLRVLRLTTSESVTLVHHPLVPIGIIILSAAVGLWIWRRPEPAEVVNAG